MKQTHARRIAQVKFVALRMEEFDLAPAGPAARPRPHAGLLAFLRTVIIRVIGRS